MKSWKSFEEQRQLFLDRGLTIDDMESCLAFLKQYNYYRFEGYFRYWQINPQEGDNTFIQDTKFETIKGLFLDERTLAGMIELQLRNLESVFRTQFAYHYASLVGEANCFLNNKGFSGATTSQEVVRLNISELIRKDLDRNIETFIETSRLQSVPYANLPIWAAVEALTFGTLSKALTASQESGVVAAIADELGVSQSYLPGQVKALVYLRNRLAHCGKIWNHPLVHKPGITPKIARRYKKEFGNFEDESVFKALCVIDLLLKAGAQDESWLENHVIPLLESNSILKRGIMRPRRYGEFW